MADQDDAPDALMLYEAYIYGHMDDGVYYRPNDPRLKHEVRTAILAEREWMNAIADPNRGETYGVVNGLHEAAADCPTWYDGCNCTVSNLLGVRAQLIERAEQAAAAKRTAAASEARAIEHCGRATVRAEQLEDALQRAERERDEARADLDARLDARPATSLSDCTFSQLADYAEGLEADRDRLRAECEQLRETALDVLVLHADLDDGGNHAFTRLRVALGRGEGQPNNALPQPIPKRET